MDSCAGRVRKAGTPGSEPKTRGERATPAGERETGNDVVGILHDCYLWCTNLRLVTVIFQGKWHPGNEGRTRENRWHLFSEPANLSAYLARSQGAPYRLGLAPLSSGTDYIDRFMEPALLHDPVGTSWPSSDLPNVRRKYVFAKNSRESCAPFAQTYPCLYRDPCAHLPAPPRFKYFAGDIR